MDETRDANRRVQFPEAGVGYELILRNSGVRVLFNTYGANYMSIIEGGLLTQHYDMMDKCLDVMAFRNDVKTPLSLDELDHVTLELVATKLLDAFTLACNGRTYLDQVAKITTDMKARAASEVAEPVPTTGPADSSESSSEEPTGPV